MGEFEVNKIKRDWASPHYFVSEDERRLIEQYIPNFYQIVQQSIPIPQAQRKDHRHIYDHTFYDKFIALKEFVKVTLQIDYLQEIQKIGWHEMFLIATGEDVVEYTVQAYIWLGKIINRLKDCGVSVQSVKSFNDALNTIHNVEL
jgi:peptidase E